MDSVTDYFEEQTLQGLRFEEIMQRKEAPKTQEQLELEKLVLAEEDIKLLMDQLEVTKQEADRLLRRQRGDLLKAIESFV
ncbi:hypothetical protein EDD86DRAFT_203523 [Gorgonomyces haynaldii]|nr:hypothetical protein EDD86DRAFT_203523 [Gorgonomyces haynaldii]